MKSIRYLIRNFFGFSRAQTNGFVVLLVVIFAALFSKPMYHSWVSNRTVDFSKEGKILDSLTAQWELQKVELNYIPVHNEIVVALSDFNPNEVTTNGLIGLGFSERMANRLINFRSKGGEFRIKSDLKKLYGMDSAFYKRLFPFIQLPEAITYQIKTTPFNTERKVIAFNLNEADTIQLQRIFGVGPVLAKRIIKYRERLGGFVSNDQLKEVYGLDSAVVKKIVKASFLTENFIPRKININTADEAVLSAHPYASRKIASAIVTYRFQHGNYQSIDDLRKIEIMDKRIVDKIYIYLAVE